MSFRHQAERRPITIEAPGPAGLHDLETRFVVPIEDLVCNAAVRPAVHEGQRVRPAPGDADDCDQAVRQNAANYDLGSEVIYLSASSERASCSSGRFPPPRAHWERSLPE